MSDNNLRMQMELSPERSNELTVLMYRLGLKTKNDLFNNALTILEWMTNEVSKGNDVASIDRSRKHIKVLNMSIFDHLRGKPN